MEEYEHFQTCKGLRYFTLHSLFPKKLLKDVLKQKHGMNQDKGRFRIQEILAPIQESWATVPGRNQPRPEKG